ncbi:unnamed protein product [Prorocentrum cordatum]|uniref:EGF-like domain-containing protein n=1 Tax=Prorocentrum cordatum TaxID=2364126 RepID=A0ABN9SQU3_9DINO|nr:unnamed protein product [Polarella glacialis]
MAAVRLAALLAATVSQCGCHGASCNTVTPGTCLRQDCFAWRGPTYCSALENFACVCRPGHCVNRTGGCSPDPRVPTGCTVGPGRMRSCMLHVEPCDARMECSNALWGVCQCLPGLCWDDETSECVCPPSGCPDGLAGGLGGRQGGPTQQLAAAAGAAAACGALAAALAVAARRPPPPGPAGSSWRGAARPLLGSAAA